MIGGKDADTTVFPEFELDPAEVLMLEMEDVLFHLDSAVMMPERPQGKSSSDGAAENATDPDDAKLQEDQDKVSGLQALALGLKQFEFDPEKRLLIAGHTDTSGAAKMNFELSDLRAQNVMYLLEGTRDKWAEVSKKRHRIEDYQQILLYVKNRRSWADCDPVKLDDKWSNDVSDACKAFISHYNDWVLSGLAPAESVTIPEGTHAKIKNDGAHKWPMEMWLAVYDIYNDDIAAALQVSRELLTSEYRSRLKYCDDMKKYLSCGESFPIDDAEKSNYRSQVNRRVELFFFDKENIPVIDCPARVDTVHKAPECPMWHKYHFKRIYPDGTDLTSVVYHLRFVYYHLKYGKLDSAPDGLQFQVSENDGAPLPSKCKWKDGVYSLKVNFGNRLTDPTRSKLQFVFEAAGKWIFKSSADDAGKIVTDAEMQKALKDLRDANKSDAEEKWKYYDLPAKWISDDWCARPQNQAGGGVTLDDVTKNQDKKYVFRFLFTSASPAADKFKPFGGRITQPAKPIVFSLDDLVLTAANLAPENIPVMQRIAVLDDKFGVINPDATNHQSYYTEKIAGTVAADGEITTGLMVSSYLPFFGTPIGGVVAQNKLYATFKDRLTAGQRLGHRAAVYNHATKCTFVASFQQRHYRVRENKTNWNWSLGNFDCYLLREKGYKDGEEISYIFSYFRWHLQDKVATSPVVTPTWIDDSLKNITNAWNDFEDGGTRLVSLFASNELTKQRVNIRFYIQHVDLPQQHTIISVHPAGAAGRSFMSRDKGEIRSNQTARAGVGTQLTAAHETGHASSLDDDYHEKWDNCCYGMMGLPDFKPGAPYNADSGSMMMSNLYIRARHYWHYAEWLRTRLTAGKKYDFIISKWSAPDYKLPFNPTLTWDPADVGTDADHYLNYPSKQENNRSNSVSGTGRFNLYLYPLGEDRYSQALPRILKKFTALLVVKVNLRLQYWDPLIGASATMAQIVDSLGKIDLGITRQFADNNVIKICGDAPYTETLVQFQPRYLVNNYTPEYAATYSARLDTAGKYNAQRDWILTQPEAQPHYEIDVANSGTSEWDDFDDDPGELDLAVADSTDFWKYFAEMVGLTNGQTPSATNFAVGDFVPNGTVKLA